MIDFKNMSASGLYKKMQDDREPFHRRAKDASCFTIPQLFPESYTEKGQITYPTPFQSLGARGVNNLANKIILSLFPPATAFFKLGLNPLEKKNSGVSDGQVQEAMYTIEKGVVNEMEISQLRSSLVDLLKQCIVGGSSVIYVPEKDDPKVFSMENFVIKRSKSGKVIRLIIKESVNFLELPSDIQEELQKGELEEKELKGEKDMSLFTLVQKDMDKYRSIQEIKGIKIKGSEGSYKEKEMPYIFVPFVDRKEDYGRSYVEDFIGDLKSYEGLRQSILEASSEAARLIYLVKPNAILTPRSLQKANSGDVVLGNPDDVSTLQADKRMDVGMAQTEAETLRTDLATIFLLDSAVRRNAERVTAEEIRRVSQELEISLGGIYSTLANVLQEPLVNLFLKRLVKKGLIDNILKSSLKLEITTGSAALGRGTEYQSIRTFFDSAVAMLGPEQASKFINVPEALKRIAYSLDVNTGDLVKSVEQLAMEAQQEQQAAMEQQAVGPAINAANQQALNENKGN